MKTTPIPLSLGLALLGLVACVMPPSVFERASWGQTQQHWQDQGRYRQEADETVAAPARAPEPAKLRPESNPQQYITSNDPRAEQVESSPAPAPEPPLYAWDGGVVQGAPQGRVAEQEGTPRGLETPPAGRMHIIELYQQVLDERDALATEVEMLRKTLDQTSVALEAKTKEAQDLTAQVAVLETTRAGLMSDNQDIAARLVQAQIRRLEAEKLLLETRIEIERAKAEEAALAAAAQAKGAAKRTPSPAAPKNEAGEKPE